MRNKKFTVVKRATFKATAAAAKLTSYYDAKTTT
jgi:hypothetical protein